MIAALTFPTLLQWHKNIGKICQNGSVGFHQKFELLRVVKVIHGCPSNKDGVKVT